MMITLLEALVTALGKNKVFGYRIGRFPHSRGWSPMPWHIF